MLTILDLTAFAVNCAVSRTVAQHFAWDLVTCVLNWHKGILNFEVTLCRWWGVQIQELTDTLSGQLISSVQLPFKCASVWSSMTVLDTGDSGGNSNWLVYWPRSRRQRSTPDWAVRRMARCWSVPGRRSGQGGQRTSPLTPALCLWSVSQLISHARCTRSVNQSNDQSVN